MKRIKLLLINAFLVASFAISNAQNLVPNPGFENYFSCPVGAAEFYQCQDWSSYGYSPDYFHSCSPGNVVGVPNNNFGFQFAASGNAYAGFVNESGGPAPPREYLGVALSQPLTTGQKYYASFMISFAGLGCPSANMGIRLSTMPNDSSNIQVLNNDAVVYNNSTMSDTLNWFQVTGSFIADSNYTYLGIGNFSSNMSNCPITTYTSYYFLDDVCLSVDSLTCFTTLGIDEPGNDIVFDIFPNPFFDELYIKSNTPDKLKVTLYDASSRKVFSKQFVNSININMKQFDSGIYLYEIKSNSGIIKTGKLVKN